MSQKVSAETSANGFGSLSDSVRDSGSRAPRRMALIDSHGKIVAVNSDWSTLTEQTGADPAMVGPGANYLDVCRRAGRTSGGPRKALAGICEVLKANKPYFGMDYTCRMPSGTGYFRMNVTPIPYKNARVAISHTDITDLQLAKIKDFNRLQRFARLLISAQEEERQRISREIHDDLGSRIAFMSFSARRMLEQYGKSGNILATLPELKKVVDGLTDLSAALRNISHDLHPPSLRYVGIGGALNSLRAAFEETYRIHIDVHCPSEAPILSDEIALCIFRIAQECLQNIAKHSGATQGSVVLECTPDEVQLTVSDNGRGFIRSDALQKGGVGLLSMEERALSIGGRVTVKSSRNVGTDIRLVIPLRVELASF